MEIRQQIVSSARRRARTYSGTNKRLTITVHETGNSNRGANAARHADLQSNGNVRNASWHWQVDDKEAVQSFPHTDRCWHAGDGRGAGNMDSIAIEICVNSDGNFRKAVDNAAVLVRKIMDEEGISIANVVQHNHWSGKNCPTNLRNGSKGIKWSEFLKMVSAGKPVSPSPAPKPESKPKPKPVQDVPFDVMVDEVIRGVHGNGHMNRRKSLGVSKDTYKLIREEVNRRLAGSGSAKKPAPKPTKSVAVMAQEVLAGKHGNGHTNRRKSLGVSEAVYQQVRAEVNRLAHPTASKSPKVTKSIHQMATEVIRGDHGNGHEARRKSLGVNATTYAKVRANVNQRTRGSK